MFLEHTCVCGCVGCVQYIKHSIRACSTNLCMVSKSCGTNHTGIHFPLVHARARNAQCNTRTNHRLSLAVDNLVGFWTGEECLKTLFFLSVHYFSFGRPAHVWDTCPCLWFVLCTYTFFIVYILYSFPLFSALRSPSLLITCFCLLVKHFLLTCLAFDFRSSLKLVTYLLYL